MSEKEKSIQDLEKEKMEIEIDLLRLNLEKGKTEELRSIKPGEIIRKNISIFLAIISVVGGILGIVIPLNNFFKEKRQEQLPKLNKDIIELVKQLNGPSASEIDQEDNIIMLTYYGLNAIPILLQKLNRSQNQPETSRLINAIKNIHAEYPAGVVDKVYYSFKEHFNEDNKKNNIDETSEIYTRYVELLINLNLDNREKKGLINLIKYVESEIPKSGDPRFKSYLEIELKPLFSKFSIDSIDIKNK